MHCWIACPSVLPSVACTIPSVEVMDPEQYPFFQLLTSSLEPILDSATPDPKAILETTLIATLRGLQELLRREQRAAFHDHLPGLISSIENRVAIAGIDAHPVTFHVFCKSVAELFAIVGRATGLLQQDGEPKIDGVSTQLSRPPPIPETSSYHNTATVVTTNGTSQRPRSFPVRKRLGSGTPETNVRWDSGTQMPYAQLSMSHCIRLRRREWHDQVTEEAMAAVKTAMGGFATHCGHWYNYANGRPVSL